MFTSRDCPYYLIYRVSLLATSDIKRELRNAGIDSVKPAYLGTLMSLWYEERVDNTVSRLGLKEGPRMNDLGKRAGLEPSSMTGLVDRMERDGLVTRAPDPEDRRSQVIILTGRGSALQEEVMRAVNRALEIIFRGIPAEEAKAGKSFLAKTLANITRENP